MGIALKSAIRRRLPGPALAGLKLARSGWREARVRRCQRAFARADPSPEYLDAATLEALAAEYTRTPSYAYDPDALERRGEQRALQVLGLPGCDVATRVLELGCGDGMTSAALARRGRWASAADARASGFDARARAAGVRFHAMAAERLAFDSQSFDLVFGYNSFEHFRDPEAVLEEMTRVVRPGGSIFLSFNPLYGSAFGQHAWGTLAVPYCQFLFSEEMIDDFAARKGRKPVDFSDVNGWSLAQYRDLWDRFGGRLQRVRYVEGRNLQHLDLIHRYPSCFRSKCDDFESLLVASIEVLFRRIG